MNRRWRTSLCRAAANVQCVVVALHLSTILAACHASWGELPLVQMEGEAVGFKMLVPDASARVCETTLFGLPIGDSSNPPLPDALRQLVIQDAEADVVRRLQIRSWSMVTGVLNRRCVEATGDIGRIAPVVRLPPMGGHEGHQRSP